MLSGIPPNKSDLFRPSNVWKLLQFPLSLALQSTRLQPFSRGSCTLEAVLSLCCWKGSRQCGPRVASFAISVSFLSGYSAVSYSYWLLTLTLSCQNTLSLFGESVVFSVADTLRWRFEAHKQKCQVSGSEKTLKCHINVGISISVWLMYYVYVYTHKYMCE